MADNMAQSHFKYGTIKDSAPQVNFIQCLEDRLELYKKTGNTDWLVDVANNAMIEFIAPAHPDAHYRQTDSDESPGRRFYGKARSSQRHALDFNSKL
jgi:hypothetical protein